LDNCNVLAVHRSILTGRLAILVTVFAALVLSRPAYVAQSRPAADVLIIGAGIAGLSAALEAARAGASVLVVDMSTVGGGHAILSNGAVSIIGTPLQATKNIADSPALAEKDFLARGEDNDPRWVAAYVRDSREWLYDWLTQLGVSFETVLRPPGNSVARLHMTNGKGLGLVEPIYRACLRHPKIRFMWATVAEDLIVDTGRITGAKARDLRRGTRRDLNARHVIVATGGFQSNLKRVMENWPSELGKPVRLLAGAAHSAMGSGHELVRRVSGRISRLDHQWNYVLGLPDPRDPSRTRGLAAFNMNAIWVNADGKRFTAELGDEKLGLRALLNQPGGTYWNVFDEKGKGGFSITLAGWENVGEVRRLVYDTPGIVLRADSLVELAAAMSVPASNLTATVSRYNQLAAQGIDPDFQAFTEKTFPKPQPIGTAPFYAAQFFPITRKSMGGVDVDVECRVLNASGRPIPGLYAIGEVTGFGGINGKAALEGTFLGPAIYMGRIAGRRIAQQVASQPSLESDTPVSSVAATVFPDSGCVKCHDIRKDVTRRRAGYWHFEQSHTKALARGYVCSSCHGDLFPYRAAAHRFDLTAAVTYCRACHGVQPREGQPAKP
jgi:flavocytochrome c